MEGSYTKGQQMLEIGLQSTRNQALQELLTQYAQKNSYQIIPTYAKDGKNHDDDISRTREAIKKRVATAELNMHALEAASNTTKLPLYAIFEHYWTYILPLFDDVLALCEQHQKSGEGRPVFVGIQGSPGTGKTTFGALFRYLAEAHGKTLLSVSTDDYYLPFADRKELRDKNPKFLFRGPPGTIDVHGLQGLVERVLDTKRADSGAQTENQQNQQIRVPIFDKSLHGGEGDVKGYTSLDAVPDILVLEGWFNGFQAFGDEKQLAAALESAVAHAADERDVAWAIEVNAHLRAFAPIFARFDRYVMLYPSDYRYTLQWRIEAEHKMKARGTGAGMSDDQIHAFIKYFWRSLHPLVHVPRAAARAHYRVELDQNRAVVGVQTQ